VIVLICTLEPYRIEWLPQFVKHYRHLGVERFLLTLQLEPGAAQAEKEQHRNRFRQTLAELDIEEAYYWEQAYDAMGMGEQHRRLQAQKVSPNDWVVWSDSDEFQVYPQPLRDIIAQCEAARVDFIRGAFIDRVAADFSLAPFDPERAIWENFSQTFNVSAALAGADPRKVTLARGWIRVSDGNHFPLTNASLTTLRGWVQVHHFKWDATLIERLRYRLRPEWQAKCFWWVESKRLVDYFVAHGSRFDPTDLIPLTLQGPHFINVR
jgi:hypothetical protein